MEVRSINCVTIPHSRAQGHSAVKAAAYRAGENLREEARNPEDRDRVHRYMNRAGDVAENFILLPEGAPDWAADRATLWNRVEQIETHKNARVSRDIQLGLAYELTPEERKAVVSAFAQREVLSRGFAADIAFHDYGRMIPAAGADGEGKEAVRHWANRNIPFVSEAQAKGMTNEHVVEIYRAGQCIGFKHYQPHAHILIPPRAFENGEFVKNKTAGRHFNLPKTAKEWRYEWPKMQNEVLEAKGIEVRVTATGEHEDRYREAEYKNQSQDKRVYEIEQRIAREDQKARSHYVADLGSEGRQATSAEIAAVVSGKVDPHLREVNEQAKQADSMRTGFAKVHNEAITRAYDHMANRPPGDAYNERQQRLAIWWRNASLVMKDWPDHMKDHAKAIYQRVMQSQSRGGPDR